MEIVGCKWCAFEMGRPDSDAEGYLSFVLQSEHRLAGAHSGRECTENVEMRKIVKLVIVQ